MYTMRMNNVVSTALLLLTLATGCIVPPSSQAGAAPPKTVQAEQPANDNAYADPAGRFSAPLPTNWTATELNGYALLRDPEETIKVYLMALAEADSEVAITMAWRLAEPSLTLNAAQSQEQPAPEGIDQMYFAQYETSPTGGFYQASARIVDDTAYIMLVAASVEALQRRGPQVNIIDSGFTITGLASVDLADVAPLPVDDTIRAELRSFIEQGLQKYGLPGTAVAVVQNGQVVYQEAFGTTVLGGDVLLTPQTHMMIGSTGKSLTTLLMATLVDEGLMTWDTPVIDLLPQFKVADAQLTQSITMRNLVCACTGVPRRDLEVIFNAGMLTAEDIVQSLQTFEFFTNFGETFHYSNQMVGTAGYATATAAGATFGKLEAGYSDALQRHVLGPLGMVNTTIAFDEVLARGNYALPHEMGFGVHYQPIKVEDEKVLKPIAPAGTHWSTLEDMTNYLIMALNKGIAVDGTRVVSEENLGTTWEPQIPISADMSYGLGWFVDEYKGAPLIHHGGNTLGFTSDFAFLPEHGLGIVVLTNARASNFFNQGVRNRLFELAFAQEPTAGEQADFQFAQLQEKLVEPQLYAPGMAEAVLAPYLGTFRNAALGDLTLTLVDGVLTADAGEFAMTLLSTAQDGNVRYVMLNGLLSGTPLTFDHDAAGAATISFGEGIETYTFTAVNPD